jgi:ATP-dependent DNA helicase RecG
MTPAELDALLALPEENEHVEFKEAKANFHFEKLVEYAVALANEGGGRIVLGVSDKPPRRVVGSQAFELPARTCGGLHERLQIKVLCHEIQHPAGRVLVFEVPGRARGQPLHVEGRYLMRAGDELVPMSPDRLRTIFAEGEADFVEQAAASGLDEGGVVALLDVQGFFDLRNRPLPSTRAEMVEALEARRYVLREPGGGLAITNLGALVLAKRLGDFDSVARKGVRVIVYDGVSKLQVKDGKDWVADGGYAVGFEKLVDQIHAETPASEEIRAALRKTTHAYPKKALREILGNALVHQDLTERGTGVVVEVYDDRLEVVNPGRPLLDPDRFIDENQSRNERLAYALRQLGVCDERGHGMDAVVSHIEAHQLPPYQCRLGSRHTTVVLSRYKALNKLAPDERVQAVYQHCCLRFVSNQITNNESIRERFQIEKQNAAQASRLLREALEAGRIKPQNASVGTKLMRYVPYWA